MNKKKPLISVIIPVYNTEKYLNRCLESVTGQSYPDLQIILVDDGSTDGSGAACDEWAKRDDRIRVIHKDNEGLGLTRNCGMRHAEGELVTFVDSDDYLEPDAMEKLLGELQKRGGDACYGGCIDVARDGSETYGTPPSKTEYTGREVFAGFVGEILGAPPESSGNAFAGVSVWGALYNLEFLKKNSIYLESEREVLSEDIFFNIKVCRAAEKIIIAPYCLYCYCENDSSLTKKYREDRFEAVKGMRALLKERLAPEVYENEELKRRMDRNYMDNLIHCMRLEVIYRKKNGRPWCMAKLREMAEDPVTRQVLGEYPIRRLGKKQRLLFRAVNAGRIGIIYILVKLRYRIW